MQAMQIQAAARQLLDARGSKAIADAAQKALACEKSGNAARATDWRKIEDALKIMRGPRVS